MDGAPILYIVFWSLLGAEHAFVIITAAAWRLRRYHKGLGHSGCGFLALGLSLSFVAVTVYFSIFPSSDGTPAIVVIEYATVFCLIPLSISLPCLCYCVYIDGTEVVKRTLFSEIRIDLKDEGTFIEEFFPYSIDYWVKIYSGDNRILTFNSARIEGDKKEFLENCKKIQLENCKKIQNAKDH